MDLELFDCFNGTPESRDDVIHVVLNDQKEGIFLCPACGNGVIKDLSKFVDSQAAIRVKCKCKCGQAFRTLVERRRNARKSVDLVGMCHFIDSDDQAKKQLIKIHDVSFSGLQFSVNNSPGFRVGGTINVDFRLDDRMRSEIKAEGIVVRTQSRKIGLQFESNRRPKALSWFLMK